MRIFLRLLLVATLALLPAACAGRSTQDGPVVGSAQADTPVRVRNQSWLNVNVYVVIGGGQRVRLGQVSGNSTATLRIPSQVVGLGRDVSFIADPVGSRSTATSFNMYVRPGEEITLTIPPTVR